MQERFNSYSILSPYILTGLLTKQNIMGKRVEVWPYRQLCGLSDEQGEFRQRPGYGGRVADASGQNSHQDDISQGKNVKGTENLLTGIDETV